MDAEKLAAVQDIARPLLSIDAPVNPHEANSKAISDVIADDQAIDPEAELFFTEGLEGTGVRWAMRTVLEAYDEEQRFIMEQYHGLDGGPGKTFQEIAHELGCERTKVGRIHHAIEKEVMNAVKSQLAEQELLDETGGAQDRGAVVLA